MSDEKPPRNGTKLYDVLMRIAFPLIVIVGTSATGLLWAHESRLTVIEVRSESIKEDLAEIKADVKKLLEGR